MEKTPYSILPQRILKKYSHILFGISDKLRKHLSFLDLNLKQIRSRFTAKEYLAACLFSTLSFFLIFSIFLSLIFLIIKSKAYLFGVFISFTISLFIFLQQLYIPKQLANKKIKGVERNLLNALQDMLIQLNSGTPLFNIMVNISNGDYGEISEEFKWAVREINIGRTQISALEDMANKNPSIFFKRIVWQITNGMKAGGDISSILQEIIDSLAEQQLIQIQNYGSQLNPLAMFYMLVAVIVPSLGITFLIIILSFTSLSEFSSKLIFFSMLALNVFVQIMFMGIIRSRRPTLMVN